MSNLKINFESKRISLPFDDVRNLHTKCEAVFNSLKELHLKVLDHDLADQVGHNLNRMVDVLAMLGKGDASTDPFPKVP